MKKNDIIPKLIWGGLSRDHRTNLWLVLCSCGKQYSIPSTMFSSCKTQCNKCGKMWMLDYNKEIITEVLL